MWISLAVLLLLLLGSAFCSASETALFSLDLHQRETLKSRRGRAALVLRHIERPNRTLATLLLANMVLNVVIAVLITGLALDALGETGLPVAIAVSTLLLVLFGEIVPKTYALRRGEGLSLLVAPGVEFLAVVLAPVRILVERLTAAVVPKPRGDKLDSDELETLLEESQAAGEITPFEALVLHRALDFGELRSSAS
jgi:putative hemolysin